MKVRRLAKWVLLCLAMATAAGCITTTTHREISIHPPPDYEGT